jgi:pimeloyl-ACP methyl ester carboxylesterase
MAVIEKRDIDANGLSFETLLSGPADGEPVLLLHGYPQSAGAWERSLHWLAAHGYRGIAPNLRGYSPGANPQEVSAYAIETLTADVTGIADALGAERFHLVGHDWGGALAWAVAAAVPERVGSLTVLSTPHPYALAQAMRESTQMLRSGYFAFFRLPRVPEAVMSAGNFIQMGTALRISGLQKSSWQRDRARLRRTGLRGPLNWYRAASVPRRQRRVTVPTLYVWGRHDPFLGRHAAELTERFVKGPYRFVALDAGHWLPERNADELHDLLGDHLVTNRVAPAAAATSRTRRRAPSG